LKIFGFRAIYGKSLKRILKEYNQYSDKYSENYFYFKFLTNRERKFVKSVYMTIYQNEKGIQYIRFTEFLPQPNGVHYNKMSDLIGAKTGYNTEVISCERCYIIN